ncbi:hypothetical protein F511_21173 [Dorcoceras hygrometricum]|uniref:CCHC-type domain-containing protein n=1 Tax=Dorcoceras hygrometricum TaxID=472368 RepID=A0A2Z7A8B6_9LAMI|nr:hypothetical protein F511_21173 [Dorcoceras hygrometricum]
MDRDLVITIPSVEADMLQTNVEECLAFAVFAINLDILHEFVLNVILGIHRIREQREQCQFQKGKPPLYIHFNPRISSKVDKEEAKHKHSRPNTFADALNCAKGAESGLRRQRRSQFVAPDARASQEEFQVPPPPRFDAGSSSSGKKNFFPRIGKQLKRSGTSSSSSPSEFKQLGTGQGFGDYCTKCGGRHATDQCRGVSGLCRIFNQPGHFARVCPQRDSGNTQNPGTARTVPMPERQASSVYSFQPQNQQQGRQGGSQTVSQPPKQQARVFALTEEQAHAAPADVI